MFFAIFWTAFIPFGCSAKCARTPLPLRTGAQSGEDLRQSWASKTTSWLDRSPQAGFTRPAIATALRILTGYGIGAAWEKARG
jgi:hypothetical protein